MNKNTISIVLLVGGMVLFMLGLPEYGAFGARIARVLGGGPPERAWILMINGAVAFALGAWRLLKK